MPEKTFTITLTKTDQELEKIKTLMGLNEHDINDNDDREDMISAFISVILEDY